MGKEGEGIGDGICIANDVVMMECLMLVLVAMGNYIETIRHCFYFLAGSKK